MTLVCKGTIVFGKSQKNEVILRSFRQTVNFDSQWLRQENGHLGVICHFEVDYTSKK